MAIVTPGFLGTRVSSGLISVQIRISADGTKLWVTDLQGSLLRVEGMSSCKIEDEREVE